MKWKDELRKLPVPDPPDELLARILVAFGWLVSWTVKPPPMRHAGGPPIWSLDGMPLFPTMGLAQEQRVRDVRPRYALITTTVPSAVRAGRWTYEARWITDGVFTSSQGQ